MFVAGQLLQLVQEVNAKQEVTNELIPGETEALPMIIPIVLLCLNYVIC
jgi:hypothetical protein